jgi:hypothetical protein
MPDAGSLYSKNTINGCRMPALYIQKTLLSDAGCRLFIFKEHYYRMPDADSLFSESAIIGCRMPTPYIQRALLSDAGCLLLYSKNTIISAGCHFKFA